ncbi:MAG: cysteine hydrolase [Acidimicrobiaceae bacterium]|nr:cysteine hydrolase [Acidimicrobiaceae bacterium]
MPDSALLLMDVQNAIVDRFADSSTGLLERLARAARAARRAPMPVIHVRVAFRPGAPEISARNRSFAALTGNFDLDSTATQIHPALEPMDGDIVVVKKRVSAFSGSDLETILRSQGVTSLVLAGIATSGVVLSTLRQAADLDYDLTVLDDGCADADAEVHRVLTTKIFPRQAKVIDVAQWVEGIGAGD